MVAVIAVIAVAARATGTTRAEGPGAGPTGTRARIKRPRTRRRAAGTLGIERTVNAVVAMVMPADGGAGEEDHGHHEHDACDDHHPRRHLI